MRNVTKNFRMRAAILIALAYAFCALAPSAALALNSSPAAFHCLAELAGMSVPEDHASTYEPMHSTPHQHDHADKGVADKSSDSHGKAHTGNCCGLFCMSAMAHDPEITLTVSAPSSPALPAVANGLAGCGPSRLHRPPIA
ncbi:MAG TPA: hypothetical protein VFC78_15730 [Tepidisphaeraceae bacterium]|nr:hypothetical protein [Tepidisphaeraceae bacterium]